MIKYSTTVDFPDNKCLLYNIEFSKELNENTNEEPLLVSKMHLYVLSSQKFVKDALLKNCRNSDFLKFSSAFCRYTLFGLDQLTRHIYI